uniref:Wings apart-like protein C-terminal domain-containing protein n=1 Tax=Peronospora matthiolae TaxID=2874970 RepID=A0AAV1UP35_9STRA
MRRTFERWKPELKNIAPSLLRTRGEPFAEYRPDESCEALELMELHASDVELVGSTFTSASNATDVKDKAGERPATLAVMIEPTIVLLQDSTSMRAAQEFRSPVKYGQQQDAAGRADPLGPLRVISNCSTRGCSTSAGEEKGAGLSNNNDVDAGRVAKLISRYEQVTADNVVAVPNVRRTFSQSFRGSSSSRKAEDKRVHEAALVRTMDAVERKRGRWRKKSPEYPRMLHDNRAKEEPECEPSPEAQQQTESDEITKVHAPTSVRIDTHVTQASTIADTSAAKEVPISTENAVTSSVVFRNRLQPDKYLASPEVTRDNVTRNKLSATKSHNEDESSAAGFLQPSRRPNPLCRRKLQPHTDVVLDHVLDALRRMDFDAMPTASSTLAMKTLKSAASCARCLEVPACALIYNVIVRMSTRAADLVVMQNLLMSLSNLAKFRLSIQHDDAPHVGCVQSEARRELDMQLASMLGEVLLVFSDELRPNQSQSWHVFLAAASALWYILRLLQSAIKPDTRVGPLWNQTVQRLKYLRLQLSDQRGYHAQLQQQQKQHSIMNPRTAGTANAKGNGTLLEQYLSQAEAVLDRLIQLTHG